MNDRENCGCDVHDCCSVHQAELDAQNTTPDTELNYCPTCIQMTNHSVAHCIKCGTEKFTGGAQNVEALIASKVEQFKQRFPKLPFLPLVVAFIISIIQEAITSRDTYWKERVRKVVEGMKYIEPKGERGRIYNQALDTLLEKVAKDWNKQAEDLMDR